MESYNNKDMVPGKSSDFRLPEICGSAAHYCGKPLAYRGWLSSILTHGSLRPAARGSGPERLMRGKGLRVSWKG